jgi:hypothetical protein
MPNDDEDIFLPLSPRGRGKAGAQRQQGEGAEQEERKPRPCALCAQPIAPADLVRLRVQKPAGPVKACPEQGRRAPQFDEQSLPVHFECLAGVSTMRFG